MCYYESRETGELMTYKEMMAYLREECDIDDPTNMLGWDEYFLKTNLRVDA